MLLIMLNGPVVSSGVFAVDAYVAIDYTHHLVIFAVRGTNTSSPASIAADLFSAPLTPLIELCAGCSGGAGFYYSWTSVRDVVTERIKEALKDNPTFRVLTTGHSLGAATATIAAFELRRNSAITAPVDFVGLGRIIL
jgi:pimeloyl-ACP methyl ester carboxylesterase